MTLNKTKWYNLFCSETYQNCVLTSHILSNGAVKYQNSLRYYNVSLVLRPINSSLYNVVDTKLNSFFG